MSSLSMVQQCVDSADNHLLSLDGFLRSDYPNLALQDPLSERSYEKEYCPRISAFNKFDVYSRARFNAISGAFTWFPERGQGGHERVGSDSRSCPSRNFFKLRQHHDHGSS
jgi:hypothetical protein